MFDYRDTKNYKTEPASEYTPPEEVFDADAILKKAGGITNSHPATPQAWVNKLAEEDEYIRSKNQ